MNQLTMCVVDVPGQPFIARQDMLQVHAPQQCESVGRLVHPALRLRLDAVVPFHSTTASSCGIRLSSV